MHVATSPRPFLLLLFCGFGAGASADEWIAPAAAAAATNPIAATPDAVSGGEGVYRQSCVICHGAEGRGDGQGATYLVPKPASFSDPAVQKQTDGALYWKILTGRNTMPGFRAQLTDAQRWQLVDYIRTLSRNAAPHGAP
jgi:mono/diheme cytochrome c family protein